MENTPDDSEKHIPSFFQSSCPGNIAEEEHSGQELTAARPEQGPGLSSVEVDGVGEAKKKTVVGGFTCCVPECFSNSSRNPELSFYAIPNGKSKEKLELRRRWLHMISQKNFDNPGTVHRVCSKHFVGGCKTYMNNIPTIVPKNKGKKEKPGRLTTKARNRPLTNVENTTSMVENIAL